MMPGNCGDHIARGLKRINVYQQGRYHCEAEDRLLGQDMEMIGMSPGLICLNRTAASFWKGCHQKGRHRHRSAGNTRTVGGSPDNMSHTHTTRQEDYICYNFVLSKTSNHGRGDRHLIGEECP